MHFTPRSKVAMNLARKQAESSGFTYIGSEHLLLGVLRLGAGPAHDLLESVGVDAKDLAAKLIGQYEKRVSTLASEQRAEHTEPPAADPAPTGIEAIVCADIAARQELGRQKYGQTVAENPAPLHEWLRHAYEECLDMAIYLRRTLDEMQRLAYVPPAVPCYYCNAIDHADSPCPHRARDAAHYEALGRKLYPQGGPNAKAQ